MVGLSMPWVSSTGTQLLLGVDGFNLFFLLLGAFSSLYLVGVFLSQSKLLKRSPVKMICFALLFSICFCLSVLGIDLILVALGIFGTGLLFLFSVDKEKASHESLDGLPAFLAFMSAASLVMVGVLVLCQQHFLATGTMSTGFSDLVQFSRSTKPEFWLCILFLSCFFVLLAPWPFHVWFARASRSSMLLLMAWVGAFSIPVACYGIFRIVIPMFPRELTLMGPYLYALGAVGSLLAAVVALARTRLVDSIPYLVVSKSSFIVMVIGAIVSPGVHSLIMPQGIFVQVLCIALVMPALYLGIESKNSVGKNGLSFFEKCILFFLFLSLVGFPGTAGYWANQWMAEAVFAHSAWGKTILSILLFCWFLKVFQIFVHMWPKLSKGELKHSNSLTTIFLLVPAMMLGFVGFMPELYLKKIAPDLSVYRSGSLLDKNLRDERPDIQSTDGQVESGEGKR